MEDNTMDHDGSHNDPAEAAMGATDDIVDDVDDFIDMKDAVEVRVDDDLPMEEDAEDMGMADKEEAAGAGPTEADIPDMSNFRLTSHTDSVYAVAASLENGMLSILSGGGDDKAFQYKLSSENGARSTSTQPLPYAHTDTVSSVAYNTQYVGSDPKKTPSLAAG